jgi:aminobenzoyl-glutamate utilization protein B
MRHGQAPDKRPPRAQERGWRLFDRSGEPTVADAQHPDRSEHPIMSTSRPSASRPVLGWTATATLAALLVSSPVGAQDAKDRMARHIDANATSYDEIAQEIWELAEVGYMETESSELLQGMLRDAGFEVAAGVAGIPTAFVASWGGGGPVIGILGEYDALPGINQSRSPERDPIPGKIAGHACGHHLFGTGSVAAAIAVKEWLEESGALGTIRVYGTPAEEGGAGKVYMVRGGLFDDVDAVLHWHASSGNSASATSSLANKSAKFRFHGQSAHASSAPWRGRSALDGVEAMNDMVNMMREHMLPASRIHYVITAGGSAPNVIPDFAEVYYYVRHPDSEEVRALFERVVKAAEGAAIGTETRMEYEVIHGIYALLPNEALGRAMHANLSAVGGVEYTPEERRFAEVIRTSFPEDVPPLESAGEVQPFVVQEIGSGGSTDVGDVSWAVPTTGLGTATWVPGTSAHSWQAVAAGGTSIGTKGMINAAKTLAFTMHDLFTDAELLEAARVEFLRRRGADYIYEPLLGDRDPPLDYRASVIGGGRDD